MIYFEGIEDAEAFLRADAGKKTINPVRFISVDSTAARREIKNFLSRMSVEFIFLSEYCAGEDTFPNIRRLMRAVRAAGRSVCILPLSEYLRINPERAAEVVEGFLNLWTGEAQTFRVYLLMQGMGKFFKATRSGDPRKRECVVMIGRGAAESRRLRIIQSAVPAEAEGERAAGIREYLRYWEGEPDEGGELMTLFSGKAEHMRRGNFFGDVQVISTAHEVLGKRYGMPVEIAEEYGREDQWQELLRRVAMFGTLEAAFLDELKTSAKDEQVFENFCERSEFGQWLIWLRYKVEGAGYVGGCARESKTPEEFVAAVYSRIFSYEGDEEFAAACCERRGLLRQMKSLPPEAFFESVRKAEKFFALQILTDASEAERQMIFEVFERFTFEEMALVTEVLRTTFPDLAAYLADSAECAEAMTAEQAEYFRWYRWQKVTDRLSEAFNRRVEEIAARKGADFYAMKSRNQVVSEEYTAGAAMFFVDGLGAEYMNFIGGKLKMLGAGYFVRYRVGRSNLPTVTEINKDFLAGKEVAAEVLELDNLKHENTRYPDNILRELRLLDVITEKIFGAAGRYERVIICSDHGASRPAVLARRAEAAVAYPAKGRHVYKSGRFGDVLADEADEYPSAIECDDKIIFGDYKRFVQQGAPGSEVHGGASWEEVIVPVITIGKSQNLV